MENVSVGPLHTLLLQKHNGDLWLENLRVGDHLKIDYC